MNTGGLLELISFKTDELFKDVKVGQKEELPDYNYAELEFSNDKVE